MKGWYFVRFSFLCWSMVVLIVGLDKGRILAAGWEEPEFIDIGWEYHANYPQVAMNDSGDAFCVFSEAPASSPDVQHVHANRYSGGSWGSPERLDGALPDSSFSFNWDVACNGVGEAVCVYDHTDGQSYGIYANRFASGAWSSAIQVDTGGGRVVLEPSVAVDADGSAICVFVQDDGTSYRIYAARFDGEAWGSPSVIDGGPGGASCPIVAFDGSGNALCVFYQLDGDSLYACANYFSDGAWEGAAPIGPAGINEEVSPPDLAFDGGGNAICVFETLAGSNSMIYANRFVGVGWEGAVRIDGGQGIWSRPCLSVNRAGSATCVFGLYQISGFHAYANGYDGLGWVGAERLDLGIYNEQGMEPQSVLDDYGNVTAVFIGWLHVGGCSGWASVDVTRLYSNRFSSGSWSGASIAAGEVCYEYGFPRLAADQDGNAICVYALHPFNGSDMRVQAVRYASDNPTRTPTLGPTATPTVTPTPDGVIRVNFQPVTSSPPPLFMADEGTSYASHGEYSYGWQ